MKKAKKAAVAKASKRVTGALPSRRRRPTSFTRLSHVAPFAGLGAALMYFFDPQQGRRRRAVFRDRTGAMVRRTSREAGRRGRYVAGKRHGVTHAFSSSEGPPKQYDDNTLQHKIESEVLRNYPSGGVNVNVEYGVAVLRGTLDQPEQIRSLVDNVRRVDGVTSVENLLHLPGTPVPQRGGR